MGSSHWQSQPIAAEAHALKTALTAQLSTAAGNTELCARLLAAQHLAHSFLCSSHQDETALASLKQHVQQALLSPKTPALYSVPARQQPVPLAEPSQQHAAAAHRVSAASTSVQHGRRKHRTQNQAMSIFLPLHPTHGSAVEACNTPATMIHATQLAQLTPTEVATELQALYAWHGNTRPSLDTAFDHTLPQLHNARKAFAFRLNDTTGEMIKQQDELAHRQDRVRRKLHREQQARVRAMCDAACQQQQGRLAAEQQERVELGKFVDELIRMDRQRDEQDRLRKQQQQASTCEAYSQQVQERAEQQSQRTLEGRREAALLRMQTREWQEQEQERKAALARQHASARAVAQEEIKQVLAAKQAAVLREKEEEREYCRLHAKELDRREASSRAAAQALRDKSERTFQRAGGEQHGAELREQLRREQAALQKAMAQQAAKDQQLSEAATLQRQAAKQELISTLQQQTACKVSDRVAELQHRAQLKAESDAQIVAFRQQQSKEKAERLLRGQQQRAEQCAATMEESQRRLEWFQPPMSEQERLIHRPVIELELRGFTNLAVTVPPRELLTA